MVGKLELAARMIGQLAPVPLTDEGLWGAAEKAATQLSSKRRPTISPDMNDTSPRSDVIATPVYTHIIEK